MPALQPSSHKLSAKLTDDAELQWLVEYASEVCEMPISFVSELSLDLQRFRAEIGVGVKETPIELSFCVHAVKQDDLLEVPDTTQDDRFRDHPMVRGPERLRFYAGMPLTNGAGQKIGSFCVMDRQPRSLDELQRRTLALLARFVEIRLQLIQATERLKVEREERRRVGEEAVALMKALTDGSPTAVAQIDRGGKIQFANDTFAKLMGVEPEDATGRALAECPGVFDELVQATDLAFAGDASHRSTSIDGRPVFVQCDPEPGVHGAILRIGR